MTQLEAYADYVRACNHKLYLKDMLAVPQFRAEYRRLNVWLRDKMGWTYTVKINRAEPGLNLYTFIEPDTNGQMRLVA